MIVFQWSAVALEGRGDRAMGVIKRWAKDELAEIGWPSGKVYRRCHCGEAITVEYCFDDMSSFERAWECLMKSEKAALFWLELQPFLEEDQMDRQLYQVCYARAANR